MATGDDFNSNHSPSVNVLEGEVGIPFKLFGRIRNKSGNRGGASKPKDCCDALKDLGNDLNDFCGRPNEICNRVKEDSDVVDLFC